MTGQEHTKVFGVALRMLMGKGIRVSTKESGLWGKHNLSSLELLEAGNKGTQSTQIDHRNSEMRKKKKKEMNKTYSAIFMWIKNTYPVYHYLLKLNISSNPTPIYTHNRNAYVYVYPKTHIRLFTLALFVTAPN